MSGTEAGRRRRLALVIIAVLSVALAACVSTTPTPVPTPTHTPRPTFTRAPLATATVPPTATPSPTQQARAVPTPTVGPSATATPDPKVNPLTGQRVADPSLLQKRPIHVCIDNDPGSRPHYGLTLADVVYEYVMERFYNTRITAVYWGQEAERIGPVRSARLINLELTPKYDALLACTGGSDPVRFLLLGDAKTRPAFPYIYFDIDLDDPSYTRYVSVYGTNSRIGTKLTQTSTAALRKYLQDKNKEATVKVPGFVFSAEGAAPPGGTPATSISIPYPSGCCAVEWRYDAARGRYLRIMDGAPHTDGATKEQISAANVIVQYVQHQDTDIVEDPTGATAYRYVLTGEGKASIFRDGVAIAALWRRAGMTDFTSFVDAQGKPIPLRRGNTWIEIVHDVKFDVTFR